MPVTITTKVSSTPNAVPLVLLADGELAVNRADGKLWVGKGDTVPVPLIGPGAAYSGIDEAPEDGQLYGRQDAAWEVIVTGGGAVPPSTAINNSLRADNTGNWVENSYVKLASDGIIINGTSNNWAQMAILNGYNVPTSAVSSAYSNMAVTGVNAGIAIISDPVGTSAIAMGDQNDIDAGGIRYNNNTDILELWAFNDVALELTTNGSTFHEYGATGARVNLQGVGVATSGEWYINGTNQMFFNNTQNTSFLMYCNGNPVQILEPDGSLRIASLGTGTVYSNNSTLTNVNPSDAALKENVVDITYGLAAVNQLRPVSFEWKGDRADGLTHLGLIAQEVEPIIPDIFTDCGLRSDELIAVLIKSVQELSARIEVLEAI